MMSEEAVKEIRDEYDDINEQAAVQMLFNAHRLNWRSPADALLLARSDFNRIKVRSAADTTNDR